MAKRNRQTGKPALRGLPAQFLWMALITWLASGPMPAQSAATGSISGTVVNGTGAGVFAVVQAIGIHAAAPIAPVQSAPDGSFVFPQLPPGTYRLCATAQTPGYIDSCLWANSIPVTLAGQTLTGQTITLENAGTLQVQINDPGGLLSATTASGQPLPGTVASHLMVGVMTDGRLFLSIPITGNSNTGRTHEIAVPVDRSVSVRLVAHGFSVSTASAPATNVSGVDLPVTIASGQTNAPLVFAVAGASK